MDKQSGTIIFGATGGIGTCLARRIHHAGKPVFIAGRDSEKLEELSAELDIPSAECDATNPSSIQAAFDQALEHWGAIEGVVNCIGSVLLKPAHITTDKEFHEVIQTNLFSAFCIVRSSAKSMMRHGGSVVLISTAAARIGMSNHEAIAAAKAGVNGLARSAAATYASKGLRFNVVAPGLVQTEMTRKIWENEISAAASQSMHPSGRLGTPEDVASCITWLLSPENEWVTGQVIGVDGGLSRVLPRLKR